MRLNLCFLLFFFFFLRLSQHNTYHRVSFAVLTKTRDMRLTVALMSCQIIEFLGDPVTLFTLSYAFDNVALFWATWGGYYQECNDTMHITI